MAYRGYHNKGNRLSRSNEGNKGNRKWLTLCFAMTVLLTACANADINTQTPASAMTSEEPQAGSEIEPEIADDDKASDENTSRDSLFDYEIKTLRRQLLCHDHRIS